MKKKLIPLVVILVIIAIFWQFLGNDSKSNSILTTVKQGAFIVNVTVKGELDAEKSTNVNGPMGLQSINIYSDIKIDDLVPEGTIVDSGDYIASLDQTVILDKLKEIDANLEKLVSNINKSKIDSALELRSARDQLINQKYALEQKEIELANSKYEPPATQRKLEIDLEQAKRQLQQSIESYQLKKEKQINTIQEAIIDFNKDQNKKEQIMKVMGEFRVTAPQAGMVIYAKSWGGKKKVPGSTISPWNPRVATLPDLSNMQIKSFVNEIDISKIQVDQEVQITVDAFPDKKLKGKVVSVANIGEELNNSSAHVFEVIIKVLNQDSDLRPSMTTKNVIVTEVVDSAMYIPLECLHSNDSLIFVYTNGVKKIVETAQSNEDNIVIEKGLSPDDEIYLSIPEGAEDWEFLKD
jgi:multidrug efflux pump subunit AcrA (membrane-fusion protein)